MVSGTCLKHSKTRNIILKRLKLPNGCKIHPRFARGFHFTYLSFDSSLFWVKKALPNQIFVNWMKTYARWDPQVLQFSSLKPSCRRHLHLLPQNLVSFRSCTETTIQFIISQAESNAIIWKAIFFYCKTKLSNYQSSTLFHIKRCLSECAVLPSK